MSTDKTHDATGDPRRALASVSELLEMADVQAMIAEHSRPIVLETIQDVLARFRTTLRPGDPAPDTPAILELVREALRRKERDRLRPVVNATGIILHTGLGRAVLPQESVAALAGLNRCCNLQIDLETGLRGKRHFMCEQLLIALTGAEAALVVNNNAAATLLIVTALCAGKEVIVSRGQLIEIGGSYRLPDCVHQGGATLVEVGTTNKTHLRDYENALSDRTGAILRVNPSNYRIVGFAEEVPIAELVKLKKKQPVLVIDDLGCGALVDLRAYGLPHEPTVQESMAAGADLACFSGDKLIGGPQSGIIVGRKDLVQRIRKHPLARMLRVGKLTAMALEHALRLFLDPDSLLEKHPTLHMLTADARGLKRRADALKKLVPAGNAAWHLTVREDTSEVGGGSLPAFPLKTYVLAVSADGLSAERLCRLLREHEPPIIARIREDEVLLDMRTLMDGDDDVVVRALSGLARSSGDAGPS